MKPIRFFGRDVQTLIQPPSEVAVFRESIFKSRNVSVSKVETRSEELETGWTEEYDYTELSPDGIGEHPARGFDSGDCFSGWIQPSGSFDVSQLGAGSLHEQSPFFSEPRTTLMTQAKRGRWAVNTTIQKSNFGDKKVQAEIRYKRGPIEVTVSQDSVVQGTAVSESSVGLDIQASWRNFTASFGKFGALSSDGFSFEDENTITGQTVSFSVGKTDSVGFGVEAVQIKHDIPAVAFHWYKTFDIQRLPPPTDPLHGSTIVTSTQMDFAPGRPASKIIPGFNMDETPQESRCGKVKFGGSFNPMGTTNAYAMLETGPAALCVLSDLTPTTAQASYGVAYSSPKHSLWARTTFSKHNGVGFALCKEVTPSLKIGSQIRCGKKGKPASFGLEMDIGHQTRTYHITPVF